MSSITTVSLYDTLGAESVAFIANQTRMSTIACEGRLVEKLLGFKKVNGGKDNLKTIITFDAISDTNASDVASGHLLTKGQNSGELRTMA